MTPSRSQPPISDLISLEGRRAIVTGGATGLGLAIAERFAEAGAAVVLADIDGPEATKAVAALVGRGYRACAVDCDVSNDESVRRMVDTAVAEIGGVDLLVNNAGVYPKTPLAETTGADFARVLDVNLKGTFLCSREAGARMIEQGRGGGIINLGSIDSLHPSAAEMSAYDASKGGVLMLTKSLARELGRHDIRVNAIAPGSILTRAIKSHMGGTSQQARAKLKELKTFMSRIALGYMGRPDDIARVALFLASDLAGYMTGTMVVVDGGYLVS